MDPRTWLRKIQRARRGGVARFPFGAPGDPLLTMLPAHSEALLVRSVVGSVDRHQQLDRAFQPFGGTTYRLRSMIKAMGDGVTFPPIVVYRLHGVCYVVDGHHRVAAALEVGQIYLDALVTECILPTEGADQSLEDVRVGFGLRTGLRQLAFGEVSRYEQALAQIHEHRWYLGERSRGTVLVQEAAADWYDTVYLPVVREIIASRLAPVHSAEEAGDLYLQLSDLKYGVSRERGHDIGFAQTMQEWVAGRQRQQSGAMLGRLRSLRLLA